MPLKLGLHKLIDNCFKLFLIKNTMTNYCNIGDKPKVFVSFNESNEVAYEPGIAPIDVTSEDYSIHTPNYNPSGYSFSGNSTNSGASFSITVRDYEIIDQGSGSPPDIRYILNVQRCQDAGLISYTNVDPNSITTNPAITCGNAIPDIKKTRIHIKKSGELNDIFTATGDYPGKFRIACGDCPAGYCRCAIPEYPGFCCLPCADLKNEIREITNMVRRLE